MNVASSKVQGAAQDLRNLCPAVITGSGTVLHRNHTLVACQLRTAADLPTSCARRGLRQSERDGENQLFVSQRMRRLKSGTKPPRAPACTCMC